MRLDTVTESKQIGIHFENPDLAKGEFVTDAQLRAGYAIDTDRFLATQLFTFNGMSQEDVSEMTLSFDEDVPGLSDSRFGFFDAVSGQLIFDCKKIRLHQYRTPGNLAGEEFLQMAYEVLSTEGPQTNSVLLRRAILESISDGGLFLQKTGMRAIQTGIVHPDFTGLFAAGFLARTGADSANWFLNRSSRNNFLTNSRFAGYTEAVAVHSVDRFNR